MVYFYCPAESDGKSVGRAVDAERSQRGEPIWSGQDFPLGLTANTGAVPYVRPLIYPSGCAAVTETKPLDHSSQRTINAHSLVQTTAGASRIALAAIAHMRA